MFRRGRRLAVVGTLGVLGLLMADVPAQAGSWSIGDPANDTIDPILTQSEATKTRNSNSKSTDITSWSLSAVTYAGQPALQATITVAGQVPSGTNLTAFQSPYPSFNGANYMVTFQNQTTQRNTYGLPPACTNKATGKPVFDFQGHWEDGYRHYLAVEITWDGTKYKAKPEIGTYDPSPDGGYFYNDIQAESGMVGKYTYSITGNTISVTVVTKYTEKDDVTCVGGLLTTDYGSPGHNIANVAAMSWLNQTVVLPVKVPLTEVDKASGIDVFGSDIESVGGLISNSDFTQASGRDAYDMGVAPWPNPDNLGDGPACPTPTFGGLLPRNPLFADGRPCQLDNPTGQHYRASGFNFVY